MTSAGADRTQAATWGPTHLWGPSCLTPSGWAASSTRACAAQEPPRSRRRRGRRGRRPGTVQGVWPPLQCSKSLWLPEQLLQPAPACCSPSAFRSAWLRLRSSQAAPPAFLLSSRGAQWPPRPTPSNSCPLLPEASPPFMPNLRCNPEVCVALRCSSLAEHPDPPGTRGGAAPAWTSRVRVGGGRWRLQEQIPRGAHTHPSNPQSPNPSDIHVQFPLS